MPLTTDHLNRPLSPPSKPQRIVSLCPSITETLYALGLGPKIVGRTRFCIHPEPEITQATRIGGTKEVKYDRLHALQPDLIIAEKEENTPEMVERLARDYPVFVTQVEGVSDAHRMIRDLGALTGTVAEAHSLRRDIERQWTQIPRLPRPLRVAYYIWQAPDMVVGAHTYIQSVLDRLGLENVFLAAEGRYPTVSEATLQAAQPELLLLSSEPFPFQEQHLARFQSLLPEARVELVDGEMFSWYGARMLPAGAYLRERVQAWGAPA